MSNTDLNIGDGFNLNNLFRFTKSYTCSGSNMTTTNGTIQSYSSITIHYNDAESMMYVEGTFYDATTTTGSATVTFTCPLRPSKNVTVNNILSFYTYSSQIIGESFTLATNGTVTMNIYGTANDNSRHTIVPVWIYLL